MRRGIIALITATAVLLSGCSEASDLRRRLVVHAIGIDYSEDGLYTVSWQVFNPQSVEDTAPIDASSGNVSTIVTKGETISEARTRLSLHTGKRVFTGNAELILLGGGIERLELSRVLNYFWDNNDIYMGVNLAWTRGEAKSIVSASLEHGTAMAELLCEAIGSSYEAGSLTPLRLIEAYNRLEMGEGFLIPCLSLKTGDEEDSEPVSPETVTASECVLISEGRASGYVTAEEASGIALLKGGLSSKSMTIDLGGDRVSVIINFYGVKRSAVIEESGWPVVRLALNGRLSVTDNPGGRDSGEITEGVREELFRLAALGYDRTAGLDGCDALDIARLLRSCESGYYYENRDVLPAVAMNTAFEMTISLWDSSQGGT